MPATAIVLGDFNLEPDSPEYQILCGATDDTGTALLTDLWALRNPAGQVMSWHSNPSKRGSKESALLDYCLATNALVTRASACWIDEAAAGSDHQPLWTAFDVA
jgi:endonuclease/exonuclease/phosphatase family metal-dependent hydrolase